MKHTFRRTPVQTVALRRTNCFHMTFIKCNLELEIMNRNHSLCLALPIVVFSAGMTSTAWATDSDVLLANANGQVTIGAANDLGTVDENFNITTRVFQGVLVPDFPPFNPADYGRDEPGFFALGNGNPSTPPGASALPGNAQVTIHFPSFSVGTHADSLFYWNGSGSVDFQPISTAQPGVNLSLHPNPIANTNADGSLHQHSAWELGLGPDGAPVPADGVYLLAPTASVVGLTDSSRFYLLYLVDVAVTNEDDADTLKDGLDSGQPVFNGKDYTYFNNAADYVRENLAPEPSGLALIGIACLGLAIGAERNRSLDRRQGR